MPARLHPTLTLVGRRLRQLREARGISQEDFSLESGLARSYYSGIERGRRNVACLNLVRIAKALNCEVGDLFPKVRELPDTNTTKRRS
jgi:transcriptional regulator with XRE-family HTH domain